MYSEGPRLHSATWKRDMRKQEDGFTQDIALMESGFAASGASSIAFLPSSKYIVARKGVTVRLCKRGWSLVSGVVVRAKPIAGFRPKV